MSKRYREYYLAVAKAHQATADAFRIDPTYDSDEKQRANFIAAYEENARAYAEMAKSEGAE